MNKKIEKKGIKEYKKLFTDNPSKWDIFWYGYEMWKYFFGFVIGFIIGFLWSFLP